VIARFGSLGIRRAKTVSPAWLALPATLHFLIECLGELVILEPISTANLNPDGLSGRISTKAAWLDHEAFRNFHLAQPNN
jgi:hypothetical protein